MQFKKFFYIFKKFDFFNFLSGYYMESKISELITTEYTTCRQH